MGTIKTVGKRGQLTLGKALAGTRFVMEKFPDGDIKLKRMVSLPENERWLHEPAMKEKLAKAEEWIRQNPPKETDLDTLVSSPSRD